MEGRNSLCQSGVCPCEVPWWVDEYCFIMHWNHCQKALQEYQKTLLIGIKWEIQDPVHNFGSSLPKMGCLILYWFKIHPTRESLWYSSRIRRPPTYLQDFITWLLWGRMNVIKLYSEIEEIISPSSIII